MEQYPTKDLTIDPQVAEEAIKRLAPEAVGKVGVGPVAHSTSDFR